MASKLVAFMAAARAKREPGIQSHERWAVDPGLAVLRQGPE
jgi:hypothetical protein